MPLLRRLCAVACCVSALSAATLEVTPADGPRAVQAALDRAAPGDTVHLAAGVYRERVVCRTSRVTLAGAPGAILDGAEAWQPAWTPAADVAPGVWRSPIPFVVFTLTAEGKIVTMLREDRVDPAKVADPAWGWPRLFRDGVGPSQWDGVKALALYRTKAKEVLLRFRGDLDPRTLAITAAPRQPVVKIDGFDRCVVRGLTLRHGAYGVLVNDSLGSVVEDCVLGPLDYGVWLDAGADRCTVRFNEIFMAPYAGADPHQRPGSWDNWQAHKKGGHYDRMGVEIRHSIGGHRVHDNWIHDHWDGIEDVGKLGENVGLSIHHNRLENLSDDGLEPNGGEERCEWFANSVRRCICGFRIKAPLAGPLWAHHNLFADNGEDYRNYGEVELKPAQVYVYHNTCTARAAINSNKVFGLGTPRYRYFNNLFWCRYLWGNSGPSVEPNWQADGNVYLRRDAEERWDTDRALWVKLGLDAHSRFVPDGRGLTDAGQFDLRLTDDSPARGAGVALRPLLGDLPGLPAGDHPDTGALAHGEPLPVLPRPRATVACEPAGEWPGPEVKRGQRWGGPNLLPTGWSQGEPGVFTWADDGGERVLKVNGTSKAGLNLPLGGLRVGQSYWLIYRSRRGTYTDLRVIMRDLGSQSYLFSGKAAAGEAWRETALRFTVAEQGVRLELSPRSAGGCELAGLGIFAEQ